MTETRSAYLNRRRPELARMRKAGLVHILRKLGHVWSATPLERWTKDDLIADILGTEADRLGLTDPPPYSPPCEQEGCGKGEHEHRHHTDPRPGVKDHHYWYTVQA